MMDFQEIRSKTQTVFQDVFDEPDLELRDDMTAEDVEEWDSLNHIKLIMTIEATFSVKFSTQEVVSLNNVGEFLSLITKHLS